MPGWWQAIRQVKRSSWCSRGSNRCAPTGRPLPRRFRPASMKWCFTTRIPAAMCAPWWTRPGPASTTSCWSIASGCAKTRGVPEERATSCAGGAPGGRGEPAPRPAPALPAQGSIAYLMTLNGPEPLEYRRSAIDYEHYIDKQLRPIADAILPFIGESFERICGQQLDLF